MPFTSEKKNPRHADFPRPVAILLLLIGIWIVFEIFPVIFESTAFHEFIDSSEHFGAIAIIFYIIMSHVIAPIGAFPAIVVSIASYGIFKTALYLYGAGIISSIINFFIARRLGRNWTSRLLGQKTSFEIQQLVDKTGNSLLIVGRLFGFSAFEIISYAAGLTSISFLHYFLITAIFSIPSYALFLIFPASSAGNIKIVFLYFGLLSLIGGGLFSLLVATKIRGKKMKPRTRTR